MKTLSAALALVAALLLATHAPGGDKPLQETLILRVGQSGFAGVTGQEYRLEPNGEFSVTQFLNGRTTSVVAEGLLGLDKLIPILQKFAMVDMAHVPPQSALYRGANPTVLQVRYGRQSVAATLPPAFSFDQPCDALRPEALCNLLELAQLVQSSVPSD